MSSDPAQLIPHAGNMMLISAIVAHDQQQIHCQGRVDDLQGHPLARDGRLPATALAEYAAQAMAVHGGLLAPAGTPPRAGLLVSLGQLDLACAWLDQDTELELHAQRVAGSESGYIYHFSVSAGSQQLASGQATIMFPNQDESQ